MASEPTESERRQTEAALVNATATEIICYMIELGPIAPSSELRHFVKQYLVELLAALRASAPAPLTELDAEQNKTPPSR